MKRNKPDANQKEIVAALRSIGAIVFLIGIPLDLLIGFRGKLMLMEIKNPDGEDKVSKSQQVTIDLLESVGVHVSVVRSVDEAIEAVS